MWPTKPKQLPTPVLGVLFLISIPENVFFFSAGITTVSSKVVENDDDECGESEQKVEIRRSC